MIGGKGWVKGLDAEPSGIALEHLGRHQGDGAKTPYIAIMQRSTVAETELESRVAALLVGEIAAVDEQRAREARLNDDTVAGGEVHYYELGTSPRALDRGPAHPSRELRSVHDPEHVRLRDDDVRYACTADLGIEVTSDGFGFRQLRH